MLPALPAELVKLQPACRGLLVLGGGVVAVFALSTLHRHNLAGHGCLPFRFTSQVGCEALSAPSAEISEPFGSPRKIQNLRSGCPILSRLLGKGGINPYAIISLMVPAPTVRPPSRIANR